MTGIYKITNSVNNKSYIGQSINIEFRWKEHQRIAKSPNNYSRKNKYPLYQAIRKYGLENFTFEILEECQEEILDEREIYWIQFFDSFENGYNLTLGGGGARTKEYDIEAIINFYKKTNNIVTTAKEFACHPTTIRKILHSFDLYGEEAQPIAVEKIDPKTMQVIEEYPSLNSAAKANKCSKEIIHNAIYGINVHAKGFYWRIKGDTNKKFAPIKKKWKKQCQQIDRRTLQIINTFESCAEAARSLGKDGKNGGSQISRVCNGGKQTAFGYIWRYIEEPF